MEGGTKRGKIHNSLLVHELCEREREGPIDLGIKTIAGKEGNAVVLGCYVELEISRLQQRERGENRIGASVSHDSNHYEKRSMSLMLII